MNNKTCQIQLIEIPLSRATFEKKLYSFNKEIWTNGNMVIHKFKQDYCSMWLTQPYYFPK